MNRIISFDVKFLSGDFFGVCCLHPTGGKFRFVTFERFNFEEVLSFVSIGDVKCSNDARTSRVFSGKFKCDFGFFLALFGIMIDLNNFVLSIKN